MNDLHEMAANSREAAWTLAASSLKTRNAALLRMAEVLEIIRRIFCGERGGYSSGGGGRAGSAPAWPAEIPRREAARRDGRASRAGCSARPHRRNDDNARNHAGLKMYRVTCPIGVIGVILRAARMRWCRLRRWRSRAAMPCCSRAGARRSGRTPPCVMRSGKRRRMSGFRRISRSCCIPARTSPPC